MDKFKFITNKNFQELPKTSGVYCFIEGKETIYIGKAINIQSRVKNHFSQPSYRDHLYIERVNRIGYLETNSEIEALVLEASLIKKQQPKFNVIWKDDKNYFYVAITKTDHPVIYITHQKNEPAEYVGPFVEGNALKKTLRFLRKVFPYYTSAKHPKNQCTYCHLGLCPGPVRNSISNGAGPFLDLPEYRRNIKKLILILQGKRNTVLNSLRKEMKQLSKENKFEEAGKIRDRIYHLQQVMAHTSVMETPKLLQENNSGETLAKILDTNPVHKVECYDISNIQGKFAVGSMVVFVDGQSDKSQYKKFKIQRENTPNDIAMLKEVITRRLTHPEWGYPEVMLIDGGIAQLNVAINAKNLQKETSQIKIISIAKGKQELWIEGRQEPISLKLLPREIFNLVKNLDDEAHRFAISYHKLLRSKNIMGRNA